VMRETGTMIWRISTISWISLSKKLRESKKKSRKRQD
jgi:hypothetical protein